MTRREESFFVNPPQDEILNPVITFAGDGLRTKKYYPSIYWRCFSTRSIDVPSDRIGFFSLFKPFKYLSVVVTIGWVFIGFAISRINNRYTLLNVDIRMERREREIQNEIGILFQLKVGRKQHLGWMQEERALNEVILPYSKQGNGNTQQILLS